jgi:branched-subunit amino acid transport protein AzlD
MLVSQVIVNLAFHLLNFSLFQELQQLGEVIGTESKGLPESVIALLPTSTYKFRIFSRKEKHEEYVLRLIKRL